MANFGGHVNDTASHPKHALSATNSVTLQARAAHLHCSGSSSRWLPTWLGGRALSCCSMAFCCCTTGRTWGRMISSRYLMPVSVLSTTTRAVLPRDEMPPHTMTLPPLNGCLSIAQLSWKRPPTRQYTQEQPSLPLRWNLDSSVKRTAPSPVAWSVCVIYTRRNVLHDEVAGEQDVWLNVVAVCLIQAID